MRQSSRELWYALLAIILITFGYTFFSLRLGAMSDPSSLLGHMLGVLGFILMLMTETLYSLRKRNRRAAHWGKADSWLRFHIFTGIVGPYMVLLHTAWKFNGLAGTVTLLMIVIVASGFFGRYIYTLLPRTMAGLELGEHDLESYVASAENELQLWFEENFGLVRRLPQDLVSLPRLSPNPWSLIIGRIFQEWGFHWRWWRETHGIGGRQLKELKRLLTFRREINYQIASLMMVRRILALWHTLHVPLGIALFTTVFIHIGVAAYYVTLAK